MEGYEGGEDSWVFARLQNNTAQHGCILMCYLKRDVYCNCTESFLSSPLIFYLYLV